MRVDASESWTVTNGKSETTALVKILGHTYLVLGLLIAPLAFDPRYLWSVAAPSLVNRLLLPKVLVLCATVAVGVLTWLVGSPEVQLRTLGRFLRTSPRTLVLTWLTIGAVVLSAFFATIPLALALTGSNARLDGALITAMWLALLPLTFAVVNRLKSAEAALPYAAIAFVVVTAYLLSEAYGLDPLSLVNPNILPTPRLVAATMGHPSIASLFEGIGIVLFGLLFLLTPIGGKRFIWAVVAILCSAGIGAAGGRAAQVGVAATWLAFFIVVLKDHRSLLRSLLVISVFAAGAFGIGALTTGYGVEKLATYDAVAAGDNASFNHRLITWRAGIAAIAERPAFGYGAGQAATTVWQHVTPAEERQLFTEFIKPDEVASATRHGKILTYKNDKTGKYAFLRMNYDKAHNYFIDLGLANGLIALALFMATMVLLLWRLLRSRSVVALAAGAAVVYYLIATLAWFPTVNVDPFMWAVAGLGLGGAFLADRQDVGSSVPLQ